MKLILSLSLALLASAAPIVPAKDFCALNNGLCEASPKTSVTTILSVFYMKLSVPKVKLHLPKFQFSIEGVPSVTTSAVTLSPSSALESDKPLESSFLLNLQNPQDEKKLAASEPEISSGGASSSASALPSAPTSALPHLRAEDARKLELSLLHPSKPRKTLICGKHARLSEEAGKEKHDLGMIRDHILTWYLSPKSIAKPPQELNIQFNKLEHLFSTVSLSSIKKEKIDKLLKKIARKTDLVHEEEYHFVARARTMLRTYDRMVEAEHRREAVHGDVIVVGVVVLFILAVLIVEVLDVLFSSLKIYLGIENHGAIRLPDDDELVNQLKTFRLMPAPKGRKNTLEKISEEV